MQAPAFIVGDTRDRYGRSLRYVYLAGEDCNARLIRDGYAHAIRRFSYTEKQTVHHLGRPGAGCEDSACGTAADPRYGTDSGRLPVEMKLARGQRTLWQGAVCTLRSARHSPRNSGREPVTLARAMRQSSLTTPTGERVWVTPFTAGRSRVRLVPTQGSRQNGPLAWRRPSLTLAVVGPARPRPGGAIPSVQVWPFPPFGVSGNAHKP